MPFDSLKRQSCTALATTLHPFSWQGQRTISITHRFVSPGLGQLASFALWGRIVSGPFQILQKPFGGAASASFIVSNHVFIKERSTSSVGTSHGLGSGSNLSILARQHGSSRTHIQALVQSFRNILQSKNPSCLRPNPPFNSDPTGTGSFHVSWS